MFAKDAFHKIEQWRKTNVAHYQLDWQWFSRYQQLASYSDVRWLAQAGPFSEEEQQEWNRLLDQKDDETASKRLSAIIAASRKRELDLSFKDQREPHFHYPRIPADEVQVRIARFSQLRSEIEQSEPNVIVRRLYLNAIDELLNELHMIEATSRHDDEAFWYYNQRLNPTPTTAEMEIAVRPLMSLLRRGLQRSDTRDLAEHLHQQINQWLSNPLDSYNVSEVAEQTASEGQNKESVALHGPEKLFLPEVVGRFFVEVFRRYQFPWTIKYDAAIDHAYVNQSHKQLFLPTNKWISSKKIRDLLGHEIETHVFRAVSGEKSLLALLSLGLGGYLETEEGLALYYAQEIDAYNATGKLDRSWLGTLATGLAAGVIGEPFTFRKLQGFLESVNTLRGLLTKADVPLLQIQEEARRNAQNRCLRTWRGVTDLTRAGICSIKDNVYLRGYLTISQALEQDTTMFERLMVGAVGIEHLADLAELGITVSSIKHQRLAVDPDLGSYIERFVD